MYAQWDCVLNASKSPKRTSSTNFFLQVCWLKRRRITILEQESLLKRNKTGSFSRWIHELATGSSHLRPFHAYICLIIWKRPSEAVILGGLSNHQPSTLPPSSSTTVVTTKILWTQHKTQHFVFSLLLHHQQNKNYTRPRTLAEHHNVNSLIVNIL